MAQPLCEAEGAERPQPRLAGVNITRVQRWVASALTLTVAYVWIAGMVLGALYTVDQSRHGAQVMIMVLAAAVGVAAIVGVRLINRLSWVTPWLVVGLLPGAAGLWALWVR
jgi:FtsH-binding integral membrane protein